MRGAYFADCHFFAAGNNQTILESEFIGPPLLQATAPVSTSGFEFLVNSEAGSSYRLQLSTDLLHWNDLLTLTNVQSATSWRDTNAMYSPRRFYRVVSP